MDVVAYILAWLLQILLSVGIIVKSPSVPGIGDRAERWRISAIVLGFIPCVGMALVAQLIYFGMYRAALGGHLARQKEAEAELLREDFESAPPGSQGDPGQPGPLNNPFDEAPSNPVED